MTTLQFVRVQSDGILVSIKLQPRSSANEICGASGSELRIRVTAPPVDAAANEALVRLLAKTLGCGRNQLELVRGHSSRHKVVRIVGLSPKEVATKLNDVA